MTLLIIALGFWWEKGFLSFTESLEKYFGAPAVCRELGVQRAMRLTRSLPHAAHNLKGETANKLLKS